MNALSSTCTRRGFLHGGACAVVAAATRPCAGAALAPLPDYWSEAAAVAAARVNALRTSTDDAFWFLTDYHAHANRLWSGRILADLITRTNCRSVYCGGDIPVAFGDKATSSTSLDGALEKYTTHLVDPVLAAGGRLYAAKGNHDFTINADYNGTIYGTGVSHTYSAAFARQFIMARQPRPFAVTNAQDPLACYYWRDAPHARVRYIVVDTSDSDQAESTKSWGVGYCMHETQIDWLARYALGTLPAGWGAVVIGHIPLAPIVGTEYGVSSYNFARFHRVLEAYRRREKVTPFTTEHDFTQAHGDILFCLSGHWHADRFTCLNGILHVTQCCDAAYGEYRKGSPFCGTLPNRSSGTVNEQALDCYQIASARGLVHATRIGAGGQSRVFHARPVTVTAGGTQTFRANHLRGPLTWACFDGETVTWDDNAATAEGYLTFAHAHLVSVTDGVLTAGTAGSGVVVAMDSAFNKEVFCVTVV